MRAPFAPIRCEVPYGRSCCYRTRLALYAVRQARRYVQVPRQAVVGTGSSGGLLGPSRCGKPRGICVEFRTVKHGAFQEVPAVFQSSVGAFGGLVNTGADQGGSPLGPTVVMGSNTCRTCSRVFWISIWALLSYGGNTPKATWSRLECWPVVPVSRYACTRGPAGLRQYG